MNGRILYSFAKRVMLAGCRASLLFLLVLTPAQAADKSLKGVALVIGNGAYAHLAALPNPANDARGIEQMLDGLGFETTLVLDRDARRLRRDLAGFVEDADGADVAFVYYSGHGIEAGGENFLVPIDADLSSLEEADRRLVALGSVLEELKASVPVVVVLLDACRSNPFPPEARLKVERDGPSLPIAASGLGAARGAAALSTGGPDRFGAMLGFAAEPGKAALDGQPGGNSPYAAATLRHLPALPGEELGTVMRMIAEEVYLKTDGRQRPWANENLRRLLYFGRPAEAPAGTEGDILGERRRLLLTIAALPDPERRQVEAVAASSGMRMDGLYAMLAALGADAPRDPAELDSLLRGQAERLKTMLAERDALNSTDPQIASLMPLVDQAVSEGALGTAIKLLDQAKRRIEALGATLDQAEADVRARRIEFAAVYARSAQAHALAFEHSQAAADYRLAFDQVERWSDRLAWQYRNSEAETLAQLARFRADPAVFPAAFAAARDAIAIADRSLEPDLRARARLTFADALTEAGRLDVASDDLEAAAALIREALGLIVPTQSPDLCSRGRNNLANVLAELGEREGDTNDLAEAVDTYRAIAADFARLGDPLAWGKVQNNFGKALYQLGRLETGDTRLHAAAAAFQSALAQLSRETAPIEWATVQLNLGNTYVALGDRNADQAAGAAQYTLAVAAYQAALEEFGRDRMPMYWAQLQNNLGLAYHAIAVREAGATAATHYASAIQALRGALEVTTRQVSGRQWASLEANLARSLMMRGFTAASPDIAKPDLEAALASFRASSEELTRETAPQSWHGTQTSIGRILQALAENEPDQAAAVRLLSEAEAAQADAVAAPAVPAAQRADILHDLALTYIMLGERGGGRKSYDAADQAYRRELALRDSAADPVGWARVQAGLGNALMGVALTTGDAAMLAEARQRTLDARAAIQPYDTSFNAVLDSRVARIDAALALRK